MRDAKPAICEALRRWINQRPGLEFGNYGNISAYRSEMRRIMRQRNDALTLLRAVELRDSITADMIIAATTAYSGRLKIEVTATEGESKVSVSYCTGQYWPTEYRAAAAAVLSTCLWRWTCDHGMAKPIGQRDGMDVYPGGLSAGKWLRASFRREYGKGLAGRWLD